jgi:hypothetical protein
VVECLKFLHAITPPGISSEEHMLNHLKLSGMHQNAWIFDRGVTMQALPKELYVFESWQDMSVRRLHPVMIQNVWDVHRLLTALTSNNALNTDVQCHCTSHMLVHNPKSCAPSYVMVKGDPDWPVGYPVKGRLQHWSVPCDYEVSFS